MSQMPAAAPQRFHPSTHQRISVSVLDRQRVHSVDSRLLRRIVKALLSELLPLGHADLALHLIAAPEMTQLNQTYLHHAGSTDVVTFNYADDAEPKASGSSLALHGEIFICMDEAVTHARRFHTTWQSELVRYIVHGILHLLGFDDLSPAARRKMKRAEDRWLRELAGHFPLTKLARGRPDH